MSVCSGVSYEIIPPAHCLCDVVSVYVESTCDDVHVIYVHAFYTPRVVPAYWVGPVLHGSAVIGFGSCVISVDLSLTLENSCTAVQVSFSRNTRTNAHAYV